MTKQDVYYLCYKAGEKYKLDPMLLLAIVEQESSYKLDAIRFEKAFYERYTRPMDYDMLVELALAYSFGLMQTMGESLREMDYFTAFDSNTVNRQLTEYLASPEQQIELGARWFTRKLKAAGGNIEKALSYWNGGGNLHYPFEVLGRRKNLMTDVSINQVQRG